MSKLREKLNSAWITTNPTEQCEQIADDFAVKFEIFKINNNITFERDGWYIFEKEHLTVNELLQIFKDKYYE